MNAVKKKLLIVDEDPRVREATRFAFKGLFCRPGGKGRKKSASPFSFRKTRCGLFGN